MPQHHGDAFYIEIDDTGGTSRQFNPDIREIEYRQEGLVKVDESVDLAVRRITAVVLTITVQGYWNEDALVALPDASGSHKVLEGSIGASTRTVAYGPAGKATGLPRIRGEFSLEKYVFEQAKPTAKLANPYIAFETTLSATTVTRDTWP